MRNVYRHLVFVLIIVVAVGATIFPPERKLKRDKDLAGGSTLVYQVDIRPTDPPDTVNRVKDLISRRLDPNGVMGITLVVQGGNRIEITMPLPNEAMKRLRREFEEALSALGESSITPDKVDRVMELPVQARGPELAKLGAGDPSRLKAFQDAAVAHDAMVTTLTANKEAVGPLTERRAAAEKELETAQAATPQDKAKIDALQTAVNVAADAEFNATLPAGRASARTRSRARRPSPRC
ncbi:MAG: hypothetical protein QM783_09150 [Phycisphaerales bacterium]